MYKTVIWFLTLTARCVGRVHDNFYCTDERRAFRLVVRLRGGRGLHHFHVVRARIRGLDFEGYHRQERFSQLLREVQDGIGRLGAVRKYTSYR